MSVKPKITESEVIALKQECLDQLPSLHRLALAYGWAALALLCGMAVFNGFAPSPIGLVAFAILAPTHWRFREQFGKVPALEKADLYDVTPGPYIRAFEDDPEFHARGIFIKREDWPRIFKTGIRSWMRDSVETFEIKALNFTAYGFMLWASFYRFVF